MLQENQKVGRSDKEAKRRRDRTFWILVAGIAVFVAAVFARIRTFVTGQDPFIYILLARRIAESGFSLEAFREVFRSMAPGYPAVLAVALKLGGPFAPYWVNPFFVAGIFVLLASLTARLSERILERAMLIACCAALLLAGHSTNAHFLIYPFRESPMLFFCLLGGWLALPTLGAELSRARAFSSGLALVLAGAMREMGWICLPFGALAVAKNASRGRKLEMLTLFLIPCAAMAIAWGTFSWLEKQVGTAQTALWTTRVASREMTLLDSLAMALSSGFHRARGFLGIGGCVILIVGVLYSVWRQRDWLLVFGLPALALLLFYGLYEWHPRYILEVVTLALPLCAVGAHALWRILLTPVRRWAGPRGEAVVGGGLLVFVLIFIGVEIWRAPIWTGRFSRGDVRRFLAQLKPYDQPNSVIFVNPAANVLTDVLVCYAKVRVEIPSQAPRFREGGFQLFYAAPETEALVAHVGSPYHGVKPEKILAHYFDLEPAEIVLQLGAHRYDLLPVRPWTRTRVAATVPARITEPQVVWLDFQSASSGHRQAVLLDGEGQTLRSWTLDPTAALQCVELEPIPGAAEFVVEASHFIPARTICGFRKLGERFLLELARDRTLSAKELFEPPFAWGRDIHKFGVSFLGEGVLNLPAPIEADDLGIQVELVWAPYAVVEEECELVYSEGAIERARIALDFREGMTRHKIVLPPAPSEARRRLAVRAEPPLPRDQFLRVMALGLTYARGTTETAASLEAP